MADGPINDTSHWTTPVRTPGSNWFQAFTTQLSKRSTACSRVEARRKPFFFSTAENKKHPKTKIGQRSRGVGIRATFDMYRVPRKVAVVGARPLQKLGYCLHDTTQSIIAVKRVPRRSNKGTEAPRHEDNRPHTKDRSESIQRHRARGRTLCPHYFV